MTGFLSRCMLGILSANPRIRDGACVGGESEGQLEVFLVGSPWYGGYPPPLICIRALSLTLLLLIPYSLTQAR
ncbi:unnamed protein product [Boreogadus saida]